MQKLILILVGLIFLILSTQSFGQTPVQLPVESFSALAIQDGGRIKPFDTFARETVQVITGSTNYQKKNATELILSWLLLPSEWSDQRFFQIKHLELKKDLEILPSEPYISPKDLMQSRKLMEKFTQLEKMQKEKKKLDPYMTAVNRLRNQLHAYNEVISGYGLKLVPQKISQDWLSIAELKDELKESFSKVAQSYFLAIAKNQPEAFTQAVADFKKNARAQAPSIYPSDKELAIELAYNKIRPFKTAYLIYFISSLLFFLGLQLKKNFFFSAGWVLAAGGWTLHTIGFAARCWIAGRPPVSNMYESIVWVSLGCLTIGMVLEGIYKKKYIMLASTFMAALALIMGDAAPAVIDQSIRPLEPVLRSNLWLTVHVLTITLSYGAFALATGIGNIALFIYAKGEAYKNKEKLQSFSLYVYRCIQVGVLLLTAGTILGGVWADYSWGRFWGWDPKETWALIADLTYLAVLHGRFTGWLKTFGTIAASVCCFAAVIMAWYGVNFVLGVGLHSYGFGAGGVHYVGTAILIQFLFVGYAYWRYISSNTRAA